MKIVFDLWKLFHLQFLPKWFILFLKFYGLLKFSLLRTKNVILTYLKFLLQCSLLLDKCCLNVFLISCMFKIFICHLKTYVSIKIHKLYNWHHVYIKQTSNFFGLINDEHIQTGYKDMMIHWWSVEEMQVL